MILQFNQRSAPLGLDRPNHTSLRRTAELRDIIDAASGSLIDESTRSSTASSGSYGHWAGNAVLETAVNRMGDRYSVVHRPVSVGSNRSLVVPGPVDPFIQTVIFRNRNGCWPSQPDPEASTIVDLSGSNLSGFTAMFI